MTRAELLAYLRQHTLGVLATVTPDQRPEAAVVAFVVSDGFELFFDTVAGSRKMENLRANPHLAFVIGWDHDRTAQYEGVADEPSGAELERLQALYFARYPEGRQRLGWPGIAYVRVRARWIRYSDFYRTPQVIEFDFPPIP